VTQDGIVYASNSFVNPGDDFAEYYESASGEEIPPFTSVVFVEESELIRPAREGEIPVGVISTTASVIGNAYPEEWYGKYERDAAGRKVVRRYLDEAGVWKESFVLAKDYDPARKYISRSERPEWNVVGLLGKVRISTKSPKAPGWIYLRRFDEETEVWIVK